MASSVCNLRSYAVQVRVQSKEAGGICAWSHVHVGLDAICDGVPRVLMHVPGLGVALPQAGVGWAAQEDAVHGRPMMQQDEMCTC